MGFFRALSGGVGAKVKVGTFTNVGSTRFSVTGIGFKPKYLAVYVARTSPSNPGMLYVYNPDFLEEKYMQASGSSAISFPDFGTSTAYYLYSIDDDGFTLNGFSTSSWRGTGYYFAIGE